MSPALKLLKTSLIVSSGSLGVVGAGTGAYLGWKDALYGSYDPVEAFFMTPVQVVAGALVGGMIGATAGAMPFISFPAAYRAYVLNGQNVKK